MHRNRLARWIGSAVALLILILPVALLTVSYQQAQDLVYNPPEKRRVLERTPADFGLAYDDVLVRSVDGYALFGWYIPSQNGAAVMLQHGYKSDRTEMLEEAAILAARGYGVLLSSIRAHDMNPGELIAFGLNEMPDFDAWFNYLQLREDVDPGRIGLLGNSLGASMAIQYAADNQAVSALVAHSAFSSMRDTIDTSIRYYTGLPAFPFAALIRFWAEKEVGGSIDDINAIARIGQLSPRPVLLLHSTTDVVISPQSGELLYEAAGEPKALWQVAGVEHARFDTQLSAEFEQRIVAFFDQYLLGER